MTKTISQHGCGWTFKAVVLLLLLTGPLIAEPVFRISLPPIETPKLQHNYKAEVLSCHDGDTCLLRISLEFGIQLVKPCRLEGVYAPELKPPLKADAAQQQLSTLIPQGTIVIASITQTRRGNTDLSLDRFVGRLFRLKDNFDINIAMVEWLKANDLTGGKGLK